jgi:RES domain-containing protein
VAAVYTSLERSTAIAEADYAIAMQPLRPHLSRQVYELSVAVEAAVDLRDHAVLASLGIGPTEFAGDDHSACQAIGGAAYWLERDGLLVPSARATGINLVLFTDRLDVDAALEVRSRENLPTEP